MDNQNLQNQINELKARLDQLNQSSTISYMVDKAFNNRGFVKQNFFVAGTNVIGVAGDSHIVIPGATAQSLALVSYITANPGAGGGVLEASIIPSAGNPGKYELYVQGLALETYTFVVFLFNQNFLTL